jgi:hypothetical protein
LWLQAWFSQQCDGDWEHQHGVEIGTLDNPGWRFEIDLTGTELEGHLFSELKVNRSDADWVACFLKDGKFHGAGGKLNLVEVIGIFRKWAEAESPSNSAR